MLQYILTGLAGIVAGIVAMRVWTARQAGSSAAAPAGDVTAAAAPGGKALDDVDTMISRLEARLKQKPEDGEGFRMLGWSYVMTGKPDKAIAPYKRALSLQPGRAVIHSGYGEALVGIAGADRVTAEAKAAFEKALSLDRTEPRARYFMALWRAQNGQEKAALDELLVLAGSGPADAPWQADVRRQATAIAGKLGVDVSARLTPAAVPATGAAPAGTAAGGQPPSVDAMVDGLAARLKASPADADGWVMLLRSRMVLKQASRAGDDLAIARKALASDAGGLARVNAAARELGVPGA